MRSDFQSEQLVSTAGRADGFEPYDYQKETWSRLSRWFRQGGESSGLLVIPTGGGKTAIATRWLLQNHVRRGGRVLWFAHRRALLRQALQSFAHAAHLADDPSRKHRGLGLILISSEDRKWSAIDDHDVVLASVQSLASERNLGQLDLLVDRAGDAGVFVVVDEAHHASAPTYGRVIERLRKRGCPILGLTATPVRMQEVDNARLSRIFGGVIDQISSERLYQLGVLAKPVIETVKTNVTLEKDFGPEDWKHLDEFGDLSAGVLERLSRDVGRNQLIADHYVKNAGKYGKTILFCASIIHARTLAAELKRRGVDADYVDHGRSDNMKVMDAYRDTPRPTVIANVEILTEGFDAPKTQTVFLARPTRSEALFRQMIGRALRGPLARGTEKAYLVTFVDTWEQFQPLEAEAVLAPPSAAEAEPPPEGRPSAPSPAAGPMLDWQIVHRIYEVIRSRVHGHFEGHFECFPHGWYQWEAEYDDDVQTRSVLVFENQVEGFRRILQAFDSPAKVPATLGEAFVEAKVLDVFFGDCASPQPRWNDLEEMLRAIQKGIALDFVSFAAKEKFDPYRLARDFYQRNVGPQEQQASLRALWASDPICRGVYRGDFGAFFDDVLKGTRRYVDEMNPPAPPEGMSFPTPDTVPLPWPPGSEGWSILRLCRNVTHPDREAVHFPARWGGVPKLRDIHWADRPLKGMWGFCRYEDDTIVLSPLLNSPDVPLFIAEFLLYHEMLHATMPETGHDKVFFSRESRFIPSPEAIDDARVRGLRAPDVTNGWQLLGDNFLDTWHRRFRR